MSDYFFYVAHTGPGQNGNGVSAIDPATGAVHATLSLGAPEVYGLVAAPGGRQLYALVQERPAVRVIDLDTFAVTGSIDVPGVEPDGPAISADGKRLYVGERGHPAGVTEIDAVSGTVVRTLDLGSRASWSRWPVVAPDGSAVYGHQGDRLFRVDLTSGEVITGDDIQDVQSLALSADGSRLYVSFSYSGLHTVDTTTLATLRATPRSGFQIMRKIAVHPDGRLFVTEYLNTGTGSVKDAESLESLDSFRQAGDMFSESREDSQIQIALSPDGAMVCTARESTLTVASSGPPEDPDTSHGATLPGDAVAITVAAAPVSEYATRLDGIRDVQALAPLRIPGLTARLTTADGAPVTGAPLRFTSAGGLDLGTATTGPDGRVQHTADLWLPLDPGTGAIDTSRLIGPYTVTYPGKAAYRPTEAGGIIHLG